MLPAFSLGVHFFPQKVLTILPAQQKLTKKILDVPGGALTTYPYKLCLFFSLRPRGCTALSAPPGYAYGISRVQQTIQKLRC